MSGAKQLYDERVKIIEDSVALKIPKRVPNCTRATLYPYFEYGVKLSDASSDFEAATEAYVKYHREFAPDIAGSISLSSLFPSRIFELLEPKCVRWPGDPKGLDENSPYQFLEYPTLLDDEYDEFLNDTAGFCIRKYLPRIYESFEPLSELDFVGVATGLWGAPLKFFLSPGMRDFYKKMTAAGEEMDRYNAAIEKCDKTLKEMGFPSFNGGNSNAAFDMLGDGLRGTFGIMPDIYDNPGYIRKCCELFVKRQIKNSLENFKKSKIKYQWVNLHKGSEEFISDEHFKEFYWPYLKRWIHGLIEEGCVPVLWCEGIYTKRLPYLTEVPPGKVVYYFEKIDLKEAKKILGGTACIMGGYPHDLLLNGTPGQIKDKVKEVMDIAAPGGGYLFSLSYAMADPICRANVEALFEAVSQYGKY